MPDEPREYPGEEQDRVAELLAASLSTDHVRQVADQLRERVGMRFHPEPRSAQELAYAVCRSSQGVGPLRDLVRHRDDYFPDGPPVRKLKSYLDHLCDELPEDIDNTPDILRRIDEVRKKIETPDSRTTFDRRHAQLAHATTLDRFGQTVDADNPPTTVRQMIQDLRLLTPDETAAKAVLDFLSRLAHLSEANEKKVLGDILKRLVDRSPVYQAELESIETRMPLWLDTIRRRTHVLVRVERDIDCDADDDARDQTFSVRIWRYWDDQRGWRRPSPYRREHSAEPKGTMSATGSGLAAHIRDRLASNAGASIVVELMADDDTLMSPALGAVIDDLGRTYAAVLRPAAASAQEARWFDNWRAAMEETDFETANLYGAGGFDEPVVGPALVINSEGPPTGLLSMLRAADVPIAAWTRRGGFIEVDTKSCRHVTFETPELFHEERRTGWLPQDAVLMWHNPHWFPDGLALRWRRRGGSA